MIKKIFSICILGIAMITLIGATKVYASTGSNHQIHLKHTIDDTLKVGQSYELNGFKYTYSGDRFYASLVTTDPEKIKVAVFYEYIHGVPVVYSQIESIATYTGLEDIIIFDAFGAGSYLKDMSIKNLYMAVDNVFTEGMKTMTIDNYHFVAPYDTNQTDFDTYNSKTLIDEMNFTNAYYYDFNEIYFQKVINTYNLRTTKKHNFIKKDSMSLKYTEESFYPFEGYEITKEEGGIKYYHHANSSILRGVTNPTNDTIPYVPYKVDSRIKSAIVRNITYAGALSNYKFETLDIRGYSVSSTATFKAERIIISNTAQTYNTSGLQYKEVYFTHNENEGAISGVTGYAQSVDSIYIPEDHKEKFQVIIDDPNIGSKVKYYKYLPTITVQFMDTKSNHMYQTMYANIDIDTVLSGIHKLESYGIEITETHFADNMLSVYGLPTKKNQVIKNDIKRIMNIYLRKGIDPLIVLEAAKEHLTVLENTGTQLQFEFDATNLKSERNSTLEVTAKLTDGLILNYTVDIHFVDFEHEVAYIETFDDIILVTKTNQTSSLSDLFNDYKNHVKVDEKNEMYANHDVSLKNAGNYTTSFKNSRGNNLLHIAVTDQEIAKGYIYYEIPATYLFTKNIDIDKALDAINEHLLYKDGKPSKEKFTIKSNVENNNIILTGMYPNGEAFSINITYSILESEIGEYIIIKDTKTNAYILFTEARTIKSDIDAKILFNEYFKSNNQEVYIDKYELPITLTKKGYIEKKVTLEESGENFTVRVVVTDKDLNPDDFKDPFKTDKDAYGEIDAVTKIKDRLAENDTLKWITIAISSILGIGLVFLTYLGIKKTIKWIKK